MIKKQTKFTNSIDFSEFEKGDKNKLMQNAGDGRHSGEKEVGRGAPTIGEPTLDEQIKGAENYYYSVAHQSSNKAVIEEAKTVYDNLMKQKVAEINAATTKRVESDKLNEKVTETKIKSNENVSIARFEADAAKLKNQTAKIENDSKQISPTEMDVFNIVKKYDFLDNPEALKHIDKSDAIILEKDLAKLGMHLQVDGKINQNTIDAVESLISKKAPAIKAYKEITGVDLLRPSAGGKKPIGEETERRG